MNTEKTPLYKHKDTQGHDVLTLRNWCNMDTGYELLATRLQVRIRRLIFSQCLPLVPVNLDF